MAKARIVASTQTTENGKPSRFSWVGPDDGIVTVSMLIEPSRLDSLPWKLVEIHRDNQRGIVSYIRAEELEKKGPGRLVVHIGDGEVVGWDVIPETQP
jgi:hypothetical protein